MSFCAYPLCRGRVSGFALICDTHKAERRADCAKALAGPRNSTNAACRFGHHQGPDQYGVLRTGAVKVEFQACTECHWCGEVHKAAAA